MKMIKVNFLLKMISLIVLLLGLVVSIKMDKVSAKIKKGGPDYSKTETPDVLTTLFKLIKKPESSKSQEYDECIKTMVKVENEEAMKTLWSSLASVACEKNELVKYSFFFDFAKASLDKIKVDGKDEECKAVVEENLLPQSEVESVSKQKELRLEFQFFFQCKSPSSGAKKIIYAFLGPHRGESPNNLFPLMNKH